MKVYSYLIDHKQTLIKVGRTTGSASSRMIDYSNKHNVEDIPRIETKERFWTQKKEDITVRIWFTVVGITYVVAFIKWLN